MAEAIFLGGKRGSGKTLGAMYLFEKYLKENRMIATNMDIKIEFLASPLSRTPVMRLPDCPSAAALEAMPLGNPKLYVDERGEIQMRPGFREDKNGLLVLDEVGTFLNSREWQGKERGLILSWLAQSRKYGWDLLLMAQHARMIDAQIRDSLIDIQGTVRNLDKIRVPVIGGIWKHFTGEALMMPRIHVVNLCYGFGQKPPLSDRMVYRGLHLFQAYNTLQKISAEFGNQHLFTLLPAWHVKGRYMKKFDLIRHAGAAGAVTGLLLGIGIGFGLSLLGGAQDQSQGQQSEVVDRSSWVVGVMTGAGMPRVILDDGRVLTATRAKADQSGERYLVDGKWLGAKK